MAPLPVKMIFATMVTLAKTKDEKKYLRMTNNWCVQYPTGSVCLYSLTASPLRIPHWSSHYPNPISFLSVSPTYTHITPQHIPFCRVRQLEYHGIPRDRMLILVTSDCPQTTITAVQALGTQIVVKPPLTVVPSALDKSYHNQPSKLCA